MIFVAYLGQSSIALFFGLPTVSTVIVACYNLRGKPTVVVIRLTIQLGHHGIIYFS
jgi:hypothetical protein